jgi:hypothetical protein
MVMTPPLKQWPNVPHYYGDIVRQLLVIGAIAMILAAPWYTDALRTVLPFIILGALLSIALAAITNPHNKLIVMADVIASGFIALAYAAWALFSYDTSTWLEFGLRQGIALAFMIAFYFSTKTLRAMLLGKVGKYEEFDEFDNPEKGGRGA